MFEALIADGPVSGAASNLAATAIKCLAVAGGFLIGYFLGAAIAWGLDRWVFAHKAPIQVKKACSLLCGVALAIVVALIVFGSGGGGLFGGGSGSGDGKGTPSDDKGKQPAPAVPKEEPKTVPKKEEPKKEEPKPTPGDVRVAILGGSDVREGKFYLIDSDTAPKTLEELKKAIADRPKEPPVVLVFRYAKEPLSDTHPEMKRLNAWVKGTGLFFRYLPPE